MNKSASFIFHGGEILTLDRARPQAEAVAVAGDVIAAAGSRAEVMALRGPATEVIDLAGRTLIPSLKDHHLHLVANGLALLNRERGEALFLDLASATSPEEIARRVARRAAELPKGTWIIGSTWNQMLWERTELPTHQLLTAAAPSHPVYLGRVDAHGTWVNQAALDAAKTTAATPDPRGGRFLRLPNGAPSGIVLEAANDSVVACIPQPSDDDITAAFRRAAQEHAARGYTDVYDAGFLALPNIVALNIPFERWFNLLCRLDAAEPLPVRVNLMVIGPTEFADRVLDGRVPREISPRLRITHLKLFSDGALGSRSAWLRQPYTDDPGNVGFARMTREELLRAVHRALDVGLDVATHAIGDAAVGLMLDVYEAALRAHPGTNPRRLRIEHFSYATPRDIERAAQLGVLLSIQPGFVDPLDNGRIMEDYRLGSKRSVAGCYIWQRLARAGIPLAGSSDDYALPSHPLWNFYAACIRKNARGIPATGWNPSDALTRQQSLEMFTTLWAPGGASHSGRLRAGAPADLTVLSADPLRAAEADILRIGVQATLRAGAFTHRAL